MAPIDLLSKLSNVGLRKVSSPATGVVQRYTTNHLSPSLRVSLESLDKTYGQSPVTTGSGVGDAFDSSRWLEKFGS